MSAESIAAAIKSLAHGGTLSESESAAAFGDVMRGEASAAQVASLLTALRVKGEHADEVAGAARALRDAMVRLPASDPDGLVDTCGTGGGAVTTFNISTAAAFVAAGAGARIAKHGNRSFTSRSGSADVLEALGVRIEVSQDVMARALESAGIVFMFAPLMHPAMRHVGPVRRELGIPTVMNIVGPLANPAGAGRQVIGVADLARVPLIAGALSALGSVHALVVHGEPGLDEVSPLGLTRVTEVIRGKRQHWSIDPAAFGFAGVRVEDLAGGEPADNARIIEEVFAGGGPLGARAAVVLNAAAALYVGGQAKDFAQGVAQATLSIDNGAARAALDRLRVATA